MSYPAYFSSRSPIGHDLGPTMAQYTTGGVLYPQSMSGNASAPDDVEVVHVQPQKIVPINPADEQSLHRGLNANQVTMIALGGTFGTGLLVGSGKALYEGGPLGILIAYAFVSGICYCMMTSLCEMATYLPHKKGFVGLVSRYVHPAVGFALGWTYLCQFLFVPGLMINTAATVVEYSGYTLDEAGNSVGSVNVVSSAVWRLIFIAIVIAINLLGIRGFGHFEFWLSTRVPRVGNGLPLSVLHRFKIIVIIALIIYGLVIDAGGAPLKAGGYDRLSFRFWGSPYGPFGHAQGEGSANTFLGFWSGMVHALFSLMGIELVGVAVGEMENPRISVPQAVKQTYRLVFTLYIIGVFIIGLICASNDITLSSTDPVISRGGLASPFIIAANRLAAKGLVQVISAAIVVFALSCASNSFYTGSRVIYGLALDHQAPALFRKVTVGGRPLLALGVLAAWCFSSYMGQDEDNSAFPYFADMTDTVGGISWMCILWAHIRFRQALNAQRYPLDILRYLSPTYPIGTWAALGAMALIMIFKGYESYIGLGGKGVVVAYIMIPWFLILTAVWKYWHNDEFKSVEEINLQEGKREIDIEEENWHIRMDTQPRQPWWERLSDYT